MKKVALILMFLSFQCVGQKHKVTYFTEGRPDTVYIIDPLDVNKTMITNKFKGVEECFIKSNQSIDSEIQLLENDTTLLIKKRRLIERPGSFPMRESGTHEAKICIDPFGNIVSIKLLKSPSKSKSYNKEVLLSMFKHRFAVKKNAPCIECGQIKITTSANAR